jgi:hypothetical protein
MRTSTYFYSILFVSKVLFFWSATGSIRFAASFLSLPLVSSSTRSPQKNEVHFSTSSQQGDGCCDQRPIPQPALSQDTKERVLNNDTANMLPSDPRYPNLGPIGLGNFLVSREGPPRGEELTNENLLKIVLLECTDLEVCAHQLVRKR